MVVVFSSSCSVVFDSSRRSTRKSCVGMVGMGKKFSEGFLKSLGVIIASEIGDKTFFIAAVMAIKNSRKEVRDYLIGIVVVV